MRRLLPLVLLAACGPTPAEDDVVPLPDAYVGCSYIGNFWIVAPKADLHYSPHLDVYIDNGELYLPAEQSLTLTMVDDLGQSYTWTDHGSAPAPGGNELLVRDKFHYELAPSHRYELDVSYCDNKETETVVFFTSSE